MSNSELPRNAHLQREWKALSTSRMGKAENAVTVISYNILASIHIKPRGYPFCPTGYRETIERHPQLMVELRHHSDADIMCLQEVETDYFQLTLLPELQKMGYHGIHHQKALGIREGVATFYRSDRFKIERQEAAHFKDWIAQKLEGEEIDADLCEMIKSRAEYETPILLTSFTCLKTGRSLTVANVHLVWQTHIVPDLNTLQAALAVQRLQDFSPQEGACVICGDFNHEPTMPGYQLIRDGCLDEKSLMHLRKFPVSTMESDDENKGSCLVDILPMWFCHNSRALKSSYAEIQGEEPSFTNYTDDYGSAWLETYSKHNKLDGLIDKHEESQGSTSPRHFPLKVMDSDLNCSISPPFKVSTLDYIWYSSDSLTCCGVEQIVKRELIAPHWACPNQVFPSDHLLMKAKFDFVGL